MKKDFPLLLIFMISVFLCSYTYQSSNITSNSTGNNQATDNEYRKKETLLDIINYDKYIEGTFISKSFSHELKRCEIKIKTSDNFCFIKQCHSQFPFFVSFISGFNLGFCKFLFVFSGNVMQHSPVNWVKLPYGHQL